MGARVIGSGVGRAAWRAIVACCVLEVISFSAAMAAVDKRADRAAFVQRVGCEIDRRIRIVAARPPGKNRFVIAGVPAKGHAYAQCLMVEEGSSILCEVASGFYLKQKGDPSTVEVPARVRALLAAEGFDTDPSEGNFQRHWTPTNLSAEIEATGRSLAGLLYDLYGARTPDDVEYEVPGAPELARAALCVAPVARLAWPHAAC
ncbi:hypothetical protein GCM10007301_23630 [Azorhizobium oxalatiphilum]|uniref:Uncharacterized protein n=1 Tax=Azorhizobium oxalatiphilum TaxID=980631 RepID=A0A917C182_9HYPH|nr:hypothetical protein [Azorhizobium oxalatiphilum]GGF63111.1 hypothetical protein GCM10007301_23630 [Azorhizobium oxalatiphilum]